MRLSRPAQLAGAAWELARFALLLLAAVRLAGGERSTLVPLLVPLAAPGLVMAAGLAAGAVLADVGRALLPLLRLGKALELASCVAALATLLLAGQRTSLAALLVAATVLDLAFLLFLLASGGKAPDQGGRLPG